MANLQETSTWEAGIYQLEITDPIEAGENGIDNLQAKQLANRTLFLKEENEDRVVEITALELLADKFFPKRTGTILGLNVGDQSGSLTVTGDLFSAAYSASSANNSVVVVTLDTAMPNTNYLVEIHLESMGDIGLDNDLCAPVFKITSSSQFRLSFQEVANGIQNIKIHIKIYQL